MSIYHCCMKSLDMRVREALGAALASWCARPLGIPAAHSPSISQCLFLSSGLYILIRLPLWKQAFSPEAKNTNLSSQVQPSKSELEFNQREAF